MKNLTVLLLVLTLGTAQLRAQVPSRAADSLLRLLATQSRPDTTRVRRLHALIAQLAANHTPHALRLSQEALRLARHLHDTLGIGRSLLWLSILHRRQEKFNEARRYTEYARDLFARSRDRRREARACLELSLISEQQGQFAAALTWALRALPLAEQAHDEELQTQVRGTIGSIYCQLTDYSSARPILRQALRDGQRLGDLQVVSAALSNLAGISQSLREWPAARRYFQQAVAVSQQMQDPQNETANEVGLGEVSLAQGNLPQALRHGLRARQLLRTTHDNYHLPATELLLARAQLWQQQPDSAIVLARHALALSQQARRTDKVSSAADVLAQAYAARRQFEQAYHFQHLFSDYQDTLVGNATQRKTSALRYGYELEKKQTQIALLNKTRQLQAQKAGRQRQQLSALLAGLAGTVLLAGLLWRNVYLKQRINHHLKDKNDEIARQRDNLTQALARLKAAQAQLIQREKMASLGELTAGIAHEIQNPLNFVNNFSEVSVELVAEFMEGPWQQLPETEKAYATELLTDLTQNLQKITQHGQRADGIVKGMLQHSHASSGELTITDLNTLVAEQLPLAYQSFRAKHKEFSTTITTHLDARVGKVMLVPQDIGRVLINLYSNAFYALNQRRELREPGYAPALVVRVLRLPGCVHIHVQDNGIGMSPEVQQKAFQPFFTTKPPGEGTGLGLSLSYDIVVQGHGGMLSVSSQPGHGTEVSLSLPVPG